LSLAWPLAAMRVSTPPVARSWEYLVTLIKNSTRGHKMFITKVGCELRGSRFHGILVTISGQTRTRDSIERRRRSIELFGTELAEQDGYSVLVVRHAE
jgi:hypothetical protein